MRIDLASGQAEQPQKEVGVSWQGGLGWPPSHAPTDARCRGRLGWRLISELSRFTGRLGVGKVACESISRWLLQIGQMGVLWWVGRPTGGSRANCFKSFRFRVQTDAFNDL